MSGFKKTPLPKVSVLMPVRNSEKTIISAVNSILNQSFVHFELIIIDDFSQDNSWKIILHLAKNDKRIRVFRNSNNLQIARTLNKGVGYCKSELIARMDADDESLPDRLQMQYQYMMKHPKVGIAGANISITDQNGHIFSSRSYPTSSSQLKKMVFRYSPFAHPTVMFRKKIFLDCNGFDPNKVPCEDIDLWLKMGRICEFGSIDKTLLKYRISPASNSNFNLFRVEWITFKIRVEAIFKYRYLPSVGDLIYNFVQFLTLWVTPPDIRITIYNFLRSNRLI